MLPLLDVSSHFPQITGTSLRFSARIWDIDSTNVTGPNFVSVRRLLYLVDQAENERTEKTTVTYQYLLHVASTVLCGFYLPFFDAARFITFLILTAWNILEQSRTAPSAVERHHVARPNVMRRAFSKH